MERASKLRYCGGSELLLFVQKHKHTHTTTDHDSRSKKRKDTQIGPTMAQYLSIISSEIDCIFGSTSITMIVWSDRAKIPIKRVQSDLRLLRLLLLLLLCVYEIWSHEIAFHSWPSLEATYCFAIHCVFACVYFFFF